MIFICYIYSDYLLLKAHCLSREMCKKKKNKMIPNLIAYFVNDVEAHS